MIFVPAFELAGSSQISALTSAAPVRRESYSRATRRDMPFEGYALLEADQRLTLLSKAWRSISANSSLLKDNCDRAPTQSSICSTRLAPIRAEVIRSSRRTQAS